MPELNNLVELKNMEANSMVQKMIKGEMQVLTQNLDEIEKMECSPPTYFRMNLFFEFHQTITETYGVPRYKEINPTLFNSISFPFQFGVMFGDILHGTILFVIGLILVGLDSKLKVGSFK